MKKQLAILVLLFVFNSSSAQELKKEHQAIVTTFVDYILHNDIDLLKTQITYPLKRAYPLPDVRNESEIKERYSEIFDDHLKQVIISSDIRKDWTSVGWRGIMLNNGIIWLDYDGRLIAINYQSDIETKKRNTLIETDKAAIHESIRNFKEPLLLITTEKFKIRIDELSSGKFRYVSWSSNREMSEKPDLIIENGSLKMDGSGGNHYYEFINGNYKYVCYLNILGTADRSPAILSVYKDNKEILNMSAEIR